MATETTEQIVRESPEVEAYKLNMMKAAAALQPPTLPEYQIAGLTPQQTAALQAGQQGIGAYAPFMQAGQAALTAGTATTGEAADVLRGADTRNQFAAAQQAFNQAAMPVSQIGQIAGIAGLGLQGVTQMYDPSSAQAFMNPYQQQVIDESMRQIDRQGAIQQANLQAQATRAGAFGGSREGVQRAELGRNLAETKNAAIINALQQGYGSSQQQAQQAFEQQKQRQLAQTQALQGIGSLYGQQSQLQQQLGQGIGGLAGQQFGIGSQMASQLGSLGGQMGQFGMQQAALGQAAQQLGQGDVNFLYNLGSQQQRQQQAVLDAQRASAMQTALQPYQQLAFQSDIYKNAPSSQMAISAQQTPTPSPFQQIAGLGTGLVAAGAAANKLF